MKIKLSFFLAKKYLQAKWSLMSTLSIIMISFGVITLITVLSIMNGFHNTFRKKILETNTYHLVIQSHYNHSLSINNIKSVLSKNKEIISIVPYFDGEGVIKSEWSYRGLIIKAFPEDVLKIDSGFKNEIKIPQGYFDLSNENNILLGEELSKEMGVNIGDFVSILTFKEKSISEAKPNFKIFKVVGIFKTGYWEYDKNMAYISLEAAYQIFGMKNNDVNIGIKIKNIFKADKILNWINNSLGREYFVITWMDINRPLFEALHNEKIGIGFVVMLIIVSGAFNIIGSLVMTVMDKKKEIGILRAVGTTPSVITRMFIIDGLYIGTIGTLIGVASGFLITLNIEKIFVFFENIVNILRNFIYVLYLKPLNIPMPQKFEILSKSIYYIEGVPVEMHFIEVFIISILAIFISVIAAYYPARKASLMKPLDTIRYE